MRVENLSHVCCVHTCVLFCSLSRLNFSRSSDVGATCAVLLFVLFTTNETKAKQIYSLSLSLSIRTFLFLVQFIVFAFFASSIIISKKKQKQHLKSSLSTTPVSCTEIKDRINPAPVSQTLTRCADVVCLSGRKNSSMLMRIPRDERRRRKRFNLQGAHSNGFHGRFGNEQRSINATYGICHSHRIAFIHIQTIDSRRSSCFC